MRLHEEYIHRHQLNVPVIRYDHKGSVFLRTKNFPYCWGVLGISWYQGRNAPGNFVISYQTVKHDNFMDRFFVPVPMWKENEHVLWDDYESRMLSIAKSTKNQGWEAVSEQERTMALWQMFLLVYDSWIANWAGQDEEFYTLVEKSIRPDLDFNTRETAFRSARRRISTHPEIAYFLTERLFPLAQGHSKWLEDLINA